MAAFSNIMDSNSFSGTVDLSPTDAELVAARARTLGPAYRLFYERPVHLVRGEGTRLYDADGEEYLDGYNNVASVGHCNPRVAEAVVQQLQTLNTHTRYLHGGIVDYSQRLLATMPDELDQIMYTCTGSEANDLALRVAQEHTGATGVIITAEAYHGNTTAVSAVSPSNGGPKSIGAHVRTVTAPGADDADRAGGDIAERFRRDVAAAAADLADAGHGVSALLIDTIFSSDGIYPEAPVLGPAVDAVRAAGGVLIADEVQPGFGRTGAGMWGFGRHGVVPDVVTVGKPMANGMPVAAMAARSEVLHAFATRVPYFNTFGGNPVSMAAASAVLSVIEEDDLVLNAARAGARLRGGFAEVAARDPRIGDIRGAGLYVGVELVDADGAPDRVLAHDLVNAMRERRVLISVCGTHGNVLKVRPPLVFSREDADRLLTEFDAALVGLS